MTPLLVVNQIFSFLAIGGQILAIFLFAGLIFRNAARDILIFFGKRASMFALIIALLATLGSLFYSEIAGYEPCKLCWFQRVFIYPQVIILGIALLRKDEGAAYYSVVLSAFGMLIAGYHYLLQLGVAPGFLCSALGSSALCTQRFVMNFGYITIPLMTFTAFLLIILFFLARFSMIKKIS